MPILKSAKKALLQSHRRKKRNDTWRTRLKNATKATRKSSGNSDKFKESLAAAYSVIDKSAKNHIITPNKAARLKSSLSKLGNKN